MFNFIAMDEQRRPDFKKYTLPPVSKKYLFRIIFYAILLTVIIVIALSTHGKHKRMSTDQIKEVNGVEIELNDSI